MTQLFEPARIGSLTLANRLVRSATAERMADEAGRPEPPLVDMYEALARGGVGLIITGHAYVHGSGRCHRKMTGVYDDELIPALEALTGAVHGLGGKVVMQINHGGRQCAGDAIVGEPLAPSPLPGLKGGPRPQELSEAQIRELIGAYARAAGRARAAGFDGVQLHGAHGYLINQFSSPATNWRRDNWGGNVARRLRFLEEVAAAVRGQVGGDYPLLIKLGLQDFVRDGLTLDDGVEIVRHLADWGMDAVEISGGLGGQNTRKDVLYPDEEAYFLPQARRAREATDLPLILVGGLRSQAVMAHILKEGTADLIALSRPLIREPDLPRRLQEGQDKASCISCNRCWPPPGEYGVKCRAEDVIEG
jgi:2,4-dienoyl-CoA reductase-like NADH-dependent reductase (Old Yellow Enzyme family)